MSRVIFLNRFFFPDHSATSQILTDVAFYVAGNGTDTHVITSRQLYDDPTARLACEEVAHDVHIHRVSTTQFGRSALSGRSIDYASYYYSTARLLSVLARRGDIVVAMTDPPLISLIAMYAARRRKAHLVNWLQDIYPEVAVQLNVPFFKGPVSRTITFLRDSSLKGALANVGVGEQMATKLRSRKIATNRIHIIQNWADDEQIKPIPRSDNPLRRQWNLEDKFVVGYSGNLGRAHEFDTILAASRLLQAHHEIIFVCIGGGRRFDDLRHQVERYGLNRAFRFFPYQNRDLLRQSLGVADVHWISLNPKLEGLIVPSKFYGVAAAGKPIIAISAREGEIAQLVAQHDCGIVIAPGDAQSLMQAIVRLSTNPELVAKMGARAREMLVTHFSRRHGLERWQALLKEVAKASGAAGKASTAL